MNPQREKSKKILKLKGFTKREIEIAPLIESGLSNKEIVEELCISLHTVQTHLKNMHKKLATSSRAKLVFRLNQIFNQPEEPCQNNDMISE